MYARIGLSTLTLLLFTAACGESTSDTDKETDSGDSTAGATADDTTGETPSTGAEPTTTPDTTGDAPTSGPTTGDDTGADDSTTRGDSDSATATDGETDGDTGEDTTGPVDPAIAMACADYCDLWTECGFQPDADDCVAGCIDSVGDVEGACKAAYQDHLACSAALTCEQLLEDPDEGGPCAEQVAQIASACQNSEEEECLTGISSGGSECVLSIECDGQLRELSCDAETCTCIDDGKQVGTCEADGICMNSDALVDKAASCCGF